MVVASGALLSSELGKIRTLSRMSSDAKVKYKCGGKSAHPDGGAERDANPGPPMIQSVRALRRGPAYIR